MKQKGEKEEKLQLKRITENSHLIIVNHVQLRYLILVTFFRILYYFYLNELWQKKKIWIKIIINYATTPFFIQKKKTFI